MRVLVTGGTGFIGQQVCRDLASEYEIVATYRNEGVFPSEVRPVRFRAEEDKVSSLFNDVKPDVVIHLLAAARAEHCFKNPELARRINTSLALSVGEEVQRRGLALIFTSTDQVFDGRKGHYSETDVPTPTCVYGQTKAQAEKRLIEMFEGSPSRLTIFRLALSYGCSDERHPGPVGWMIQLLREGNTANLFRDEIRSPLFVGDVSRAMDYVMKRGLEGLYHLGGPEAMDRHTLGVKVAEELGLDSSLCLSRSVEDHTGPEPRSPDCSLNIQKFRQDFGWTPQSVEMGLQRMKRESQNRHC